MKGRPGHMGGVDIKTTQAEDRRQARKERDEQRLHQTAVENVGKFSYFVCSHQKKIARLALSRKTGAARRW